MIRMQFRPADCAGIHDYSRAHNSWYHPWNVHELAVTACTVAHPPRRYQAPTSMSRWCQPNPSLNRLLVLPDQMHASSSHMHRQLTVDTGGEKAADRLAAAGIELAGTMATSKASSCGTWPGTGSGPVTLLPVVFPWLGRTRKWTKEEELGEKLTTEWSTRRRDGEANAVDKSGRWVTD